MNQIVFGDFPVVRINDNDSVCPRLLGMLAEFNGFPGVGAAGANQNGHTTVYVINSKLGDRFTLFGV
ncbi:hypothetical protein D3C86_2066180 [compost metagenome]